MVVATKSNLGEESLLPVMRSNGNYRQAVLMGKALVVCSSWVISSELNMSIIATVSCFQGQTIEPMECLITVAWLSTNSVQSSVSDCVSIPEGYKELSPFTVEWLMINFDQSAISGATRVGFQTIKVSHYVSIWRWLVRPERWRKALC